MSERSTPVLRRRLLAVRLRELRERANLTLAEAAPRLDKSKSSLNRIETGQSGADVHLVRSMMDLYQCYDEDLLTLTREAAMPSWERFYGVQDRGYSALETASSHLVELSLMFVPGLLQTEDYIRALFAAGRVRWTWKQREKQVAARLIRQERLTSAEDPLRYNVIIDEAALRKKVGGGDVMRAQLRQLIERAELDTVTLQVMPDDVGAHVGMEGAFIILSFPQDDFEFPDIMYVAYLTNSLHVEKPEVVAEARLVFEQLRSVALSPADSLALIERVASQL